MKVNVNEQFFEFDIAKHYFLTTRNYTLLLTGYDWKLSWSTNGFHILTDFCLFKLRLTPMSTLQPLSRFGNAAMECQFWLIFPLIWSSVLYWFLLYFVLIKCITIDLSSLLKHITAFAIGAFYLRCTLKLSYKGWEL